MPPPKVSLAGAPSSDVEALWILLDQGVTDKVALNVWCGIPRASIRRRTPWPSRGNSATKAFWPGPSMHVAWPWAMTLKSRRSTSPHALVEPGFSKSPGQKAQHCRSRRRSPTRSAGEANDSVRRSDGADAPDSRVHEAGSHLEGAAGAGGDAPRSGRAVAPLGPTGTVLQTHREHPSAQVVLQVTARADA